MIRLGFLGVSFFFLTSVAAVACSAPAAEPEAQSSEALTGDSLGVTCKTLGEIGQCNATSLCKTSSEAMCKAKASAIASDPDWADTCQRIGNEQACGWNASWCQWEETLICLPRSGRPSAAAPDLGAACKALGELGACGRVSACKSSLESVCRATDDAIGIDPQWQQMCPRAGTSKEACEVQSLCAWEDVTQCSPRGAASAPLDIGTACKTLGESGACGLVPSICKSISEPRCLAKASALASDPEWAESCLRAGHNEQACGWQSSWCTWEPVDECVPLSGPRAGSTVDLVKACDTFGQVGECSRSSICKPVSQGACRATANALAGDPEWANQCPRAGGDQATCGWLAPNCTWEPSTRCVPR